MEPDSETFSELEMIRESVVEKQSPRFGQPIVERQLGQNHVCKEGGIL